MEPLFNDYEKIILFATLGEDIFSVDEVICNPMAYTFGVFVEEDYKPAFYDAVVSMMHPTSNSSHAF